MDIPYLLPGTTEPAITIVRPSFGSPKVLVDGAPVKGRRGRFDIPLADGTTKELQLKGQWSGLKAVVDGVATPIEIAVSRGLLVLSALPIVLVVLGGLVGGVIAAVAIAINTALSRSAMPFALRIIGILGVTALGVAVWFGIAYAIAPVASFEAGTCVNGISPGAQITPSATKPVDCATAHDGEVVGTIQYPHEGAYPGEAALLDYAQAPCVEAFGTYVGSTFEASELDMIASYPTDLSWGKGDRQLACIAGKTDGSSLTGSVKGSGL